MENEKINKTALVFGATGLIGAHIVQELLAHESYQKVLLFVRKPLNIQNEKVQEIITDYDHLDKVKDRLVGDDLFISLGTTMAKAGSKEAFYKVDYKYIFNVAQLAAQNNIKHLLLVSSMGADKNSSIFYTKVKGELEQAIQNLNIPTISIFRPSLLLGDREEKRFGERIFTTLSTYLSFLYFGPFKKYTPIKASKVAKTMVMVANETQNSNIEIYESETINHYS